MDDVFRALADPSRRRLLDRLHTRSGQTLRDLCADIEMARQSVSKHLAVLEAAGLVTTRRRGREKLHYLNAAPINAIADRWLSKYDRARAQALADLKTALETPKEPTHTMPETLSAQDPFVYTTYIRTTPERLWQALTDPTFTLRYWGVAIESEWKAGATMVWRQGDVVMADPAQVVLESDPPRRLSYTWHTMTPEFGAACGFDDETLARLAAERRSKVTFEIEPRGEVVKLTVVHDGFDPSSAIREMVGEGWPELLSSLKTLLETGDTLPSSFEAAEAAPAGAPA